MMDRLAATLDLGNELFWEPARMGIELRPGAAPAFPSCSMFWGRSAALKPLLDTQAVVHVHSPEAIARLMDEHGASLASGCLARRPEPPPMVARTPPGLLDRGAGARPALQERKG